MGKARTETEDSHMFVQLPHLSVLPPALKRKTMMISPQLIFFLFKQSLIKVELSSGRFYLLRRLTRLTSQRPTNSVSGGNKAARSKCGHVRA